MTFNSTSKGARKTANPKNKFVNVKTGSACCKRTRIRSTKNSWSSCGLSRVWHCVSGVYPHGGSSPKIILYVTFLYPYSARLSCRRESREFLRLNSQDEFLRVCPTFYTRRYWA